jgi:hypothetical protein
MSCELTSLIASITVLKWYLESRVFNSFHFTSHFTCVRLGLSVEINAGNCLKHYLNLNSISESGTKDAASGFNLGSPLEFLDRVA